MPIKQEIRRVALSLLGVVCGSHVALAAAATHDMPMPAAVPSSDHSYVVPPVLLIDQHGDKVRLDQALAGDKPALVQFFFTSCTTICGVRSAQIIAAAPQLQKAGIDVGFYTITIDPERDTPQQLLAFSKQFGSTPPANWYLLTGTVANIRQVQAAFDASDPSADKMMHEPLTFIRGGAGRPWQRVDAVTTTSELVREIRKSVALAH